LADGQAPQLGEINKVMFGIVDRAHDVTSETLDLTPWEKPVQEALC
jgi:hypothetical protein